MPHSIRFAAIALCLLTAPSTLRAQAPQARAEPVGPFIAVSVKSIEPMVSWYRDTLGFTITSQGTAPNGGVKFALMQQGSALVELLQIPGSQPRAQAAPGVTQAHLLQGFFKSGLVVTNIDQVYERLKQLGVTFAYDLGQPPNGPYRSFGVRDPEGNLLQYFGR